MTYKKTKIMFILATIIGIFIELTFLYTPGIENEITYVYLLGVNLFCTILVITFWYFDYEKYHNQKFFEMPLDLFLLISYGMYFICKNNGVKTTDTKLVLLCISIVILAIAFIVVIRKKELNKIDNIEKEI